MDEKNSASKIETALGFDYGLKRLGIASGQMITRTATPLKTISAPPLDDDENKWHELDQLIKEWRPDALVIGIPLHMDGTEIEITSHAKKFTQCLKTRYNIPVFNVDERLSSVEAAREIADGRAAGTHKRQEKGDLDKLAARIILQTWFNQQGG